MIIPLVFYHCKKKWNIPYCFSDLYTCGEEINKYLLNFCYIVYNTKYLDKDYPNIILQNNIILFSSLIALKSAFEKGVAGISLIIETLKRLREAGINIDTAIIIIEYLIQTKEIKEEDIKKLMEEHTGGEIMSTVLDKYIEKGSLREKQLVLIKLLSKKFNISDDIKEYIKQCNDPVKLDNALDEILSAENPDDVLACLK